MHLSEVHLLILFRVLAIIQGLRGAQHPLATLQ